MAYFCNGIEGEIFEEKYCYECRHYNDDLNERACPVMEVHLIYNYDLCNKKDDPGKKNLDALIPMTPDGIYPDKCAMFIPR